MLKMIAGAAALVAATTLVSLEPSHASSNRSHEECQKKCDGRGLVGRSAQKCAATCQSGGRY
jgi:hypothetical protein